MLELISGRWWVLLLRGLVAIVAGVVAITMPGLTLWALIVLFGVFSILDGVASIALGLRDRRAGQAWGAMILFGVLAIAAGVIAFAWPGPTALALLYLIAAYAIVRGVFEIAAAISLRKVIEGEWLLALSGVLSILFGALVAMFPGTGALALVWWIGAFMIAVGVIAISLAFRLWRLHREFQTRSVAAAH